MKKLILSICLLLSLQAFSQDQFRREFSALYYKGEFLDGKNIFVFNVGDNNDVNHYTESGKKRTYISLSAVFRDTNTFGSYQSFKVLDPEGDEGFFVIYDNPDLGIELVYDGKIYTFLNL